jgi:hypothetical protein
MYHDLVTANMICAAGVKTAFYPLKQQSNTATGPVLRVQASHMMFGK